MHAPTVPRSKAINAGSLAVLFWGASFVGIKGASHGLRPVPHRTLRLAIGTSVVSILA